MQLTGNHFSSNLTCNSNTLNNKKSIHILIVDDDIDQFDNNTLQKETSGRTSSVSIFNDITARLYRRVSMAFQGLKRSSNVTNMQNKNQKATKALGKKYNLSENLLLFKLFKLFI